MATTSGEDVLLAVAPADGGGGLRLEPAGIGAPVAEAARRIGTGIDGGLAAFDQVRDEGAGHCRPGDPRGVHGAGDQQVLDPLDPPDQWETVRRERLRTIDE